MTVEFALFLSPEGIALAHRQEAGHWALIGDTGLDVPDLGGALAELQALGEARGGTDFPTLLILPDDQILYTELDGLGGSASIPGRLEGLTPYEVADLAYDWRDLGGGRAVLAIVARETLDEAEGFAREHGFNGVGFAASPPVEKFPGVPLFQLADDAKGLDLPDTGLAIGPDTWTPLAPEPDPVPEPEIVPEPEVLSPVLPELEHSAEDIAGSADTQEPSQEDDPAPAATDADVGAEPEPSDDADSDTLAPVMKSRAPRRSQQEPPLQMPSGFGARRGKAPAPDAEPGRLVGTRPSRIGLTNVPQEAEQAQSAAEPGDDTPPTPSTGLTAEPVEPQSTDTPTGISAPTRSPAAYASSVPGRHLSPAADTRMGNLSPDSAATDQREDAAPVAALTAGAGRTKPADTDPAKGDPSIMGGLLARRAPSGTGPSFRTGLVLTLVLLLILALIAVWSALFLPDSTVARLLGRTAPDVEIATPPERSAPSATVSAPASVDRDDALARLDPEADALPDPVESIAAPDLNDVDTQADLPDIDADIDLGPTPVDPETLLPSAEETEAFYASTGIWQRPPEQPIFVDPGLEDEIYMAAIDPVVVTHDALAIPAPDVTPEVTRSYASPAPFGTSFALGPNGLVIPTPEGATTADGVRIFAGTPSIQPVPRAGGPDPTPTEGEATQPDLDVNATLLAAFQPTPRPGDLAERRERQRLGGFTISELSSRRPTERPPSVQQLALAARTLATETTPEASSGTPGSTFDANALTGRNTTDDAQIIQASGLAVASSRMPAIRPGDIGEIVARATRSTASSGASPAAVQQASAPATVQPSIPSTATVARAATDRNAINLRNVNLIGVSGTPSNRRALVRLPSGRFVRVGVGDRVDGGRVAAIGEDSLQYVKNGRNITLDIPG